MAGAIFQVNTFHSFYGLQNRAKGLCGNGWVSCSEAEGKPDAASWGKAGVKLGRQSWKDGGCDVSKLLYCGELGYDMMLWREQCCSAMSGVAWNMTQLHSRGNLQYSTVRGNACNGIHKLHDWLAISGSFEDLPPALAWLNETRCEHVVAL